MDDGGVLLLSELRRSRGWSQLQLARRARVSQAAVSYAERRGFRAKSVRSAVCAALGVPVKDWWRVHGSRALSAPEVLVMVPWEDAKRVKFNEGVREYRGKGDRTVFRGNATLELFMEMIDAANYIDVMREQQDVHPPSELVNAVRELGQWAQSRFNETHPIIAGGQNEESERAESQSC